MIANLVFVFASLVAANAQITIDGECPVKKTMTNINMAKYEGLYYEYLQTAPLTAKCVRTTYTNTDNGVTIHETASSFDGEESISDGNLEITEDGCWIENFTTPEARLVKYCVLKTDYNYTLLYDCQKDPNNEGKSLETVYVLTKERQVCGKLAKKIEEAFKEHNITSPVEKIDQSCK